MGSVSPFWSRGPRLQKGETDPTTPGGGDRPHSFKSDGVGLLPLEPQSLGQLIFRSHFGFRKHEMAQPLRCNGGTEASILADIQQFVDARPQLRSDMAWRLLDVAYLVVFILRDACCETAVKVKNRMAAELRADGIPLTEKTGLRLGDAGFALLLNRWCGSSLSADELVFHVKFSDNRGQLRPSKRSYAVVPSQLIEIEGAPSALVPFSAASSSQSLADQIRKLEGMTEFDLKLAVIQKSDEVDATREKVAMMKRSKRHYQVRVGKLELALAEMQTAARNLRTKIDFRPRRSVSVCGGYSLACVATMAMHQRQRQLA